MAFAELGLMSVGTGGATDNLTMRNKLWHYVSADNLATISASGYFNSVADKLKKGDIIFVSAVVTGTLVVRTYGVAAITAGVVTLIKDDIA